jgi:hypothetical protein
MPWTKEETKDYKKQYYIENKEKYKEYNLKNKEQRQENCRQYRLKNKDKIREVNKEYRYTPKGRKIQRISTWKHKGLVGDYEEIYEKYMTTCLCEECNVKLTIDKINTPTTKCMDHDHQTGLFRNILCNSCNVKRG